MLRITPKKGTEYSLLLMDAAEEDGVDGVESGNKMTEFQSKFKNIKNLLKIRG